MKKLFAIALLTMLGSGVSVADDTQYRLQVDGFPYWAVQLMWGSDEDAPMQTFRYSIVYLMWLFLVMLLDHYLFPMAAQS